MATEDLDEALTSESGIDSCFALIKVRGSSHVQDTVAPITFTQLFSPAASPGRSSPDQSVLPHSYNANDENQKPPKALISCRVIRFWEAVIWKPRKHQLVTAYWQAPSGSWTLNDPFAINDPLIGDLTLSQVISEEYVKVDPFYLSRTQELPLHYSHYRPVLGDGNCGWRAFSYFEKLIEPANRAMLHSEVARIISLNNLLRTAGFDGWLFENISQDTTTLLKDLSRIGESWQALEHSKNLLLQRFNDPGKSNSIIRHLRLLASAWLKTNSKRYEAFTPDGLSIETYSKNWIELMGHEIDHLGMTLLFDILLKPIAFYVEIVYLEMSPGSQNNTYIFQPENSNGVLIDPGSPFIHLLYRPSHYDILYIDAMRIPIHFINGVPQDVNIQVNRVGSFTEPFSHGISRGSKQMSLAEPSQFKHSDCACDTATMRMYDSSMAQNSPEQTPRSSAPRFGSYISFQTSTFKNSYYDTAHYRNPNFQPLEWTPDSEEKLRNEPDRCRKKSPLTSTRNGISLQDSLVTLVFDIGQSLATRQLSPKKTLGHEHKGLVDVSAKDSHGSEIYCEQSSTTDTHASQNVETGQLDSSDADYESSDLGDFFKVFEAVQCLKIKGIAQDQKVRQSTTPLSIVRQNLLYKGMQAFWTLFDQAWSTKFIGCAERYDTSPRTTNIPTTDICQISTAKLTDTTAHGKRSRSEDDSEASGDDERNNGNKRNKSNPSSKSSIIAPGFACPYRKHDALRYSVVGKWKICALTPQSTVARVKEHLYRYHMIHQCQRCKDSFKQEKELDAHIEAKEGCESKPMKVVEGITAKMEKQLRCRKKTYRGQIDAERWKDIYKLLFPAEAVPDPYFEPVQEHKGELSSPPSASQDIAEYECYLRRELPRCFRRALEAAMNDDNDPIEEYLTSRIMDMYQDCQDLVLSSYRTNLEATSIPIPDFVPEPTIELIDQVAEYNLGTWNTGTSIEFDGLSNSYPDHQQQYDGNATLCQGSTSMQSTTAVNGNTLNEFNFGLAPNSLRNLQQKLPSSTIAANWQILDKIAVYPVEIDKVPLGHVDVPNSLAWADLVNLDP